MNNTWIIVAFAVGYLAGFVGCLLCCAVAVEVLRRSDGGEK